MFFPKLNNCQFFLVGGCVRDKILGRKSNDLDYVVYTPLTFQQFVDEVEKVGKVYQAKEEFLTVRGRIGSQDVDIAFPRYDGYYSDSRRPDSVDRVVGGDVRSVLKKDAARRDFTINTFYEDVDGVVYDFFDGKYDLRHSLLRTVGDPDKRFREDYLRIVRAIRFAVVFDFTIEKLTAESMRFFAPSLKNVAVERIMIEVNKALAVNPLRTLKLLGAFNLLDVLEYHKVNFETNNKKRRK